jgi:hypothetical protein
MNRARIAVLRKISSGIRNPYDVALDAYGNLFVANANINGNERCYVAHMVPAQRPHSK